MTDADLSRSEKEKKRLEKYPCIKKDPKGTHGILLSDEIKFFADEYQLIDPFFEKNLKPAGYLLTVGEEYSINGETRRLSNELGKDTIEIPPFEVAIITFRETINLPRFIVARWNLEVRWVYKGLLFVGGPQVDPGWVGRLLCPIYNLSNKPIRIKLHETLTLIDFIKTTPFKEKECKKYPRPPRHPLIGDYDADELVSALFTEVRGEISDIKDRVIQSEKNITESEKRIAGSEKDLTGSIKEIYSVIGIFITITFAISSLLSSAVITFITTSSETEKIPIWIFITFGLSIFSVLTAISVVVLVLLFRKKVSSKTNP